MAEYRGLRAICERMGWRSRMTPLRQLATRGFLMYRSGHSRHPRWVTSDELIMAWQVARCAVDRDEVQTRAYLWMGGGGPGAKRRAAERKAKEEWSAREAEEQQATRGTGTASPASDEPHAAPHLTE